MGSALTKAALVWLGFHVILPERQDHVSAFRHSSVSTFVPNSLVNPFRIQRCYGAVESRGKDSTRMSPLYLNFNNFSDNTVKVLMLSQEEAKQESQAEICTRHIFQGLLCLDSGLASHILREFNVTVKKTREAAIGDLNLCKGTSKAANVSLLTFSSDAKETLERSSMEAEALGQTTIETEHILLAVLQSRSDDMLQLFKALSLDVGSVRRATLKHIAKQKEQAEEQPQQDVWKQNLSQYSYIPAQGRNMELLKDGYGESPLNAFTVDLTAKAEKGKLPKVVCRDKEIDRAIRTLCRKHKRNPLLIGEPGVGKTAVVEGLTIKLLSIDSIPCLMNKRIKQLDVGLLVAGARFRGQFEERLTKLVEEVKSSRDVILVIDEAHMLVGAGAGEGALDAANLLKPSLSRGEIQCIAITTPREYRKYFEKDTAFSRRFQPIYVNEPSDEDTRKILDATTREYGKFHKVRYTESSVDAAMKYSKQYLQDRFLPDKAIDILDEAGSLAKIRYHDRNANSGVKEDPLGSDECRKSPSTEINSAAPSSSLNVHDDNGSDDGANATADPSCQERGTSSNGNNIERSEYDSDATEMEDGDDYDTDDSGTDSGLEDQNDNEVLCDVGTEHVAEVVSTMTGVPLKRLSEDEIASIRNMENEIHKTIIGQEEAVVHLCKAIRRSKAKIKNPERPIGSFLFCGPPGVGKSEIARALTRFLFAKDNLIKLDMSEYNEPHSISRILGSPPGYKGHDAGGQLTDKLKKNPYSVVMFDEIEKAHHDVLNVLLQILEDGKLTDSKNQVVSFKNAVIIMTSNVGSTVIERSTRGVHSFGFNVEIEQSNEEDLYKKMKTLVNEELKSQFKPELINRIDDIIVFTPLKDAELKQIAKLMIEEVVKRAAECGAQLIVEDSLVDYVLKLPRDGKSGARPLRKLITSALEDRLADLIISEDYVPGKLYKVSVDSDSHVTIKVEEETKETGRAASDYPKDVDLTTEECVVNRNIDVSRLEEISV